MTSSSRLRNAEIFFAGPVTFPERIARSIQDASSWSPQIMACESCWWALPAGIGNLGRRRLLLSFSIGGELCLTRQCECKIKVRNLIIQKQTVDLPDWSTVLSRYTQRSLLRLSFLRFDVCLCELQYADCGRQIAESERADELRLVIVSIGPLHIHRSKLSFAIVDSLCV